MAHWRSMTDRNYLSALDLGGKDVEVTIERVIGESVVGSGGRKANKPHLYVKGKEKPMILNATNAKTIEKIAGSPDTDKWLGLTITLFPTQCQALDGTMTDCIRVRPQGVKK